MFKRRNREKGHGYALYSSFARVGDGRIECQDTRWVCFLNHESQMRRFLLV